MNRQPTRMRPNVHRRKRTRAGFSAVEVLISMTVMAIGAAAVMSMQKATVQGDMDARETDIANAIARTWVERLERDSLRWTLPSSASPNASNMPPLLANHLTGAWFLPSDYMGATPETMSPGFDILGRDLDVANLGKAQFCVNVRLTWLVQQSLPNEPGLIRADVRVLWPRGLYNSPLGNGASFCTAALAATPDPDPITAGVQPVYHSLYVTTTIRENTQ